MPEALPQVAPSQDCLVLSSAEVAEALIHTDLAAALESALVASPGDDERRFRQLIAVDSGAFHVVGGAARLAGHELLGLKVNGRYESGRMRGTMLIVDASTGALTGLMDSGELTVARTAAMTGIAVRHLAPRNATRALVVGTGRLAEPMIRALIASSAVQQVDVWGRNRERAAAVAAGFDARARKREAAVVAGEQQPLSTAVGAGLDGRVVAIGHPGSVDHAEVRVAVADDLRIAARQADIVVTITSSEQPILHRGDVAPGTLVVAVGSDSATKQELDAELLADAAVVVDSLAQCLTQGELRSAVAAGLMTATDVRGELADIVRDGTDPRSHPNQPVVADLTGIALQDLVAARAICAVAQQRTLGRQIRLRP